MIAFFIALRATARSNYSLVPKGAWRALFATTAAVWTVSCSDNSNGSESQVSTATANTQAEPSIEPRRLTEDERASYTIESLFLGMTVAQAKSALQKMLHFTGFSERTETLPDGREYIAGIEVTNGSEAEGFEQYTLSFSGPGSGNVLYYMVKRQVLDGSGPGFVRQQLLAHLRKKFGETYWTEGRDGSFHWGAAFIGPDERVTYCPTDVNDVKPYKDEIGRCGLHAMAILGPDGDVYDEFTNGYTIRITDWSLAAKLHQQDAAFSLQAEKASDQQELERAEKVPSL